MPGPSRLPIPLTLLLLGLLGPSTSAQEQGLLHRLQPLIDAHQGQVAIAVKHLGTGETFLHRADEPMPTASLIKLPVMVEVFRQSIEEGLDLGRTLTLKAEDKVPGAGILTTDFTPGSTFALRDAVRLMIKFSDNTATNLVLDQIGIGATAATMERLGYPNTKIHSKVFRRETSVFPERSAQFGLGSTTASEMIRLCEAIQRHQILTPEACDSMLAHLRTCDDIEKFPRFLPPGTKLAFKTGSVEKVRTAAGILETGTGPVVLCVMTAENADTRWVPDNAGNRLCAEVARQVYDQYQVPALAPTDPGRNR